MATKKKKSSSPKRRTYAKKAKRSRKASPWNVAAAAGAGLTVVNLMTARSPGANNSPVDLIRYHKGITGQATAKGIVAGIVRNASNVENWYPAIGGAVISAAPKIPLVKVIAKPVSNAVSKVSHKKAVL